MIAAPKGSSVDGAAVGPRGFYVHYLCTMERQPPYSPASRAQVRVAETGGSEVRVLPGPLSKLAFLIHPPKGLFLASMCIRQLGNWAKCAQTVPQTNREWAVGGAFVKP